MITNPDQFFKCKINLDIKYKDALLIHILLTVVIFLTTTVVDYIYLEEDFLNVYYSIYIFIFWLSLPCIVCILWMIDSFILYVSQYLFSGNGSFKRILQFTAYSNVFLIPALILKVACYTLLFYPANLEYIYRFANIISVFVILLRANILRFGLKHACNMSLKNATIFVAIYSFFLLQITTQYIKVHITTALTAIAIVLLLAILATLSPTRHPIITSAKQLSIDAEKTGKWTDINLTFLDSPRSEKTGESITNLLKINIDSEELSIKDGSSLRLSKKKNGNIEDYVEINTFVFDEEEDAKKYFDYVNIKRKGTKISGLGDEASIYSTKDDGQQNYFIRISNAFVDIIVYNGNKGRDIAEQIIKKSRKIKP